MNEIEDLDMLKQLYGKESVFVLLKHSTTCPISADAFKETEEFASASGIPVYYLKVQDLREGAQDAAEHFRIKHESPQVFLLKNKEVQWHDSHWRITKDKLTEEAAKLSSSY